MAPNGGTQSSYLFMLYEHRLPEKKAWEKKSRQGAKRIKKMEQDITGTERLSADNATLSRALSDRANYTAQDRPDCSFITKELCREFAAPTTKSYLRPVRLVKYLIGIPRLVFRYDWPPVPTSLSVFVDADFAGCAATTRSTSGGVCMLGGHCVKHWATTQPTVNLASGESELQCIAKGGANALGIQALAGDLGIHFTIDVWSDASAAIGIVRRRGLGRVRHLACTDLWIQERVRDKGFNVSKMAGAENPSDIMTKRVDRGTLTKLLTRINCFPETGRPQSAPQLIQQTIDILHVPTGKVKPIYELEH